MSKTHLVHLYEYICFILRLIVNSHLTKKACPTAASLPCFSCASTYRKHTHWNDPQKNLYKKNCSPKWQHPYQGEIKSKTREGGIWPKVMICVSLVLLTVSDPTVSCQVEVKLAQHRLHPLAVWFPVLQVDLTRSDLLDVLADSFDPLRPRDFILEDIANVDSQIPDACYSLIIRNIAGLQAENEKVLMFTFFYFFFALSLYIHLRCQQRLRCSFLCSLW